MTIIQHSNRITSLIFFVIISNPIFAQQNTIYDVETPKLLQNAISIVPQYVVNNGIRIDYERRIKNSNSWVLFSPQIYTDVSGSSVWRYKGYASYESMTGFGLNMYFKKIAFQSKRVNIGSGLPRYSLYFQAGPNFQHFSLTNTEEVAVSFVEDGTTYFRFDTQELKKPINRFGAVVNAGYQLAFGWFLMDVYLGLAVKYSYDGDGQLIRSEYAEWIDINYSGISLDGGVRFGMFF